jgi:formiminotetrahydrofolate cyclodeaminase
MSDRPSAFERVLDPADNSTGGGSASAIAGAMAAALVGMVARLSVGRDAGLPDDAYGDIAAQAAALSGALLTGAEVDAGAFDAVVAGYRMPRGTDEEKSARSRAIQAALAHATRVPLENAEMCAAVLALARQLEGRSNPSAASDLISASHLARAGLAGCLANVEINLPSLKDPAVAAALRARAGALAAG